MKSGQKQSVKDSSANDTMNEQPKRSRRRRSCSSTPPPPHHHHHKHSDSARSLPPGLPKNVQPISNDDFFIKSLEFKLWLKNTKHKFIDQLDSHKSKKYFEKFVRHWNKGKLDPDYYNPPAEWRTASSGATSSHSWTFKGATTLDREKARAARQEASIGPSPLPSTSSKPTAIMIGPTLPPDFSRSTTTTTTLAEHQYEQDEAADMRLLELNARKREMKRKRKEDNEDLVAQRATGKERLLEKRLENRAAQADYLRQKDDPTAVELDDRHLFGSSNSFQEAVRARDRAQERRRGKSGNMQAEKQLVMQEKVAAMKSKEDSTMAMLKSLAASKFGPAAGSRQ